MTKSDCCICGSEVGLLQIWGLNDTYMCPACRQDLRNWLIKNKDK